MKISILISNISKTGGTERAVVTLANMLSEYAQVEILSFTKTDTKKSYYKISNKVSIVFLNNEALEPKILNKIKWSINTVSLLNKYFKEISTDIIISTGHNYNWLIPFINSNKNAKKIACEHIVYSSIPIISRLFMKLTYRFLDKIVVLSEVAAQSFYKYSKVVVIPNAIPFKAQVESQLVEKQILLVGRLSPEKGLDRLIPIASRIKKIFPDWKIVVLGDGPERTLLTEKIKESVLQDFVILKGAVKDVENYYLNSSIYIMTSYFEAFPMVLLEAQSFGLPIVAYDCPEGPSQIIKNNCNGYLINNGDINDFVDKISILIKNNDIRKQFGKNAKNNANQYTESKVVEKWISLFTEMDLYV